ncbi:MAG: hypothetical protein QNJ45_20665 [Ardenticatenaceae bacterium]|nr:hypothetical protein [Ardenticatenaceae bacterium]
MNQDVAEDSHFSPYHFHCIFRGLMAETLNDYITRRRLESATNMLEFHPDVPIIDVALNNGFLPVPTFPNWKTL